MSPIRSVVPGIALAWAADRHVDLASLYGQRLWRVDLLQRPPGDEVAIGFAFSRLYLTVFNAGAWNGMAFGPPDSHYRRQSPARAAPTGARPGVRVAAVGGIAG